MVSIAVLRIRDRREVLSFSDMVGTPPFVPPALALRIRRPDLRWMVNQTFVLLDAWLKPPFLSILTANYVGDIRFRSSGFFQVPLRNTRRHYPPNKKPP
jgi:hypothetical protein